MKITVTDKIITEYIQGKDLKDYVREWFFTSDRPFVEPEADARSKDQVELQYSRIQNQIKAFHPLNATALDVLFPEWQKETLYVDLIAGFPSPYDAVAEVAPDGRVHIIFDVIQFTDYNLTEEQSKAAVRNLLTHEFVHVLMEKRFPGITHSFYSSEYTKVMDALIFNEGIAHLLSYKSRELDETDWEEQELQDIYIQSKRRLESALSEENMILQKKRLEEAVTGPYFEKFGAMCGMLYFAEKWKSEGIAGLEQELEVGADHFSERILGTPIRKC